MGAEVLSLSSVGDTLVEAGVRKALDMSMSMSVTRSHADLELLISSWSAETYTFIASWEEFTPMLEDVVVTFRLPLCADNSATGIVFSKEERILQLLNATLIVLNKSTYTS